MKLRWKIKILLVIKILLILACTAVAEDVSERVQQLYREAKAEENQGNPDIAIQKYLAIIKLNPKLAAAHNNLGKLYFRQARYDKAIKALRLACELDPGLAAPHALAGLSFYQMRDFASARQELSMAVRLDPRDRNAKLFLARSLVELDDLKGAVKLLDQLQQQNPKDPEVLFVLGSVYASLAQSTLAAIQTADPNSYLIELLLGRYAEAKQVYPEAIEHYRKAIEKAPDATDLYYRYAHALWASGDFEKALAEYRRALAMNPYDYRAYWEAARIVLPNDPEEALRLANRALELKPDISPALTIRGRALLALKKPREAVEDFKKAATLDPDDSGNHFQLARAYRQQGLNQQAQNETEIYERMEREAHTPKEGQPTTPP